MMRLRRSTFLLVATPLFYIMMIFMGCAGTPKTLKEVDPYMAAPTKGTVFGIFKILYDGKVLTNGSTVNFSNGESFKLGFDGFVALPAGRGNIVVTSILLRKSGREYPLQNLDLKVGPPGTLVYFGHVVVAIESANYSKSKLKNTDIDEKWDWAATDKTAEAKAIWHQHFRPNPNTKFYARIAKKIGSGEVKVRNREIATDRASVETGF